MLDNWQGNANANQSDEEAFFLKACLQEIASRIVDTFTKGIKLTNNEISILRKYWSGFEKLQPDGILAGKLAQIDGMPKLVKDLCRFTVADYEANSADGFEFNDKLLPLVFFCVKFIKNGNEKHESILERMKIVKFEKSGEENEQM
ncbi:hypothetical protein niasHS_009448 [Heterodera schachtii]|uniref:Uncharacterized protein n=1 Tax=Heterodera schachtii TaxID=97005 RepID=A0ABD2J4M6_HETSC